MIFQECQLLTLSENALPPQNERLAQIIRFMSTMRQQMLTMARRVQEQPCWKEEILADELEETEHSVTRSRLIFQPSTLTVNLFF